MRIIALIGRMKLRGAQPTSEYTGMARRVRAVTHGESGRVCRYYSGRSRASPAAPAQAHSQASSCIISTARPTSGDAPSNRQPLPCRQMCHAVRMTREARPRRRQLVVPERAKDSHPMNSSDILLSFRAGPEILGARGETKFSGPQ